jgi:hypothetical protein
VTTRLVVFRMPQSATYHLAEPDKVNSVGTWSETYHLAEPDKVNSVGTWSESEALCGSRFGSTVTTYDGDAARSEIAALPLYRQRVEFHRCDRCDRIARER